MRDFRDWHGIRSTPQDWLGLPTTVLRPDFHFDQRDKRWAEVIIEYSIPRALADRDKRSLVDDVLRMIGERQAVYVRTDQLAELNARARKWYTGRSVP